MNAPADMPKSERPISEEFRIVAKAWVDADAGARLLEELKTTHLEQQKQNLVRETPALADSHAERIVKASPQWETSVREMVDARTAANRFKVQLEYIRMKSIERQSINATAREEMRMGGR